MNEFASFKTVLIKKKKKKKLLYRENLSSVMNKK